MVAIALAYATRDGQTRRIAGRIASTLERRGHVVDAFDVVASPPTNLDIARYDAAIVASSVRIGKHAAAMLRFVRAHRQELARVPNMFLAVSLSAHGAVDPDADEARRTRARAAVEETFVRFTRDTGWTPNVVHAIAGALLYRQYGWPLRAVMRFISRMAGASTDTSRDHVYTNWAEIERYANELADRCEAGGVVRRKAIAR